MSTRMQLAAGDSDASEVYVEATLTLLEACGWTRHAETEDVTPAEIEALENTGTFTRGGQEHILIGQTDTGGDTYCTQEPDAEGQIILSPYEAGIILTPPEKRYYDALVDFARAVLCEVPDNCAQCVAFSR